MISALERTDLKNLLLIDDDLPLLEAIRTALIKCAQVTHVQNHHEFLATFQVGKFDLVLTEYKMNFWEELEVISHIKSSDPHLPIIVISTFTDKETAIKCANLQVHRVLEKPLVLSDFIAALEAVFSNPPTPRRQMLQWGPMILSEESYSVEYLGENIQLTETEFNVMKILIQNVNKRVDRADFQRMLWGKVSVSSNVLDTHLLNLKKKLPLLKERLKNIRGKGYFLPIYQKEKENGF